MNASFRAVAVLVFVAASAVAAQTEGVPPEQAAKQRAIAAAQASVRSVKSAAAPTSLASFTSAGTPTTSVQIQGVAGAGSVNRFDTIELVVSLTINGGSAANVDRPYEVEAARGGLDLSADFTSPSGVVRHVNGFYDGVSTPGQWKIRFVPDQISTTVPWTYTVTAKGGTTATATGSFTCAAQSSIASKRGWLRVDGKGLRFSGDNGWFWGLGHNTGWKEDVEVPSAAVMRSNGENVLSFWMAEPWIQQGRDPVTNELLPARRAPLENVGSGLGNYNQSACAYIDSVVANAEAAGLYLVPSLWAHDELRDANAPWGNASWGNNAYQSVCPNGPSDFFITTTGSPAIDTEAWHYQKNRYRYIIARWGCSPAIAGWVGLVEIDGTAGIYANGASWAGSVRTYLAGIDPFRTNLGKYPFVVTKTDNASSDAATFPSFLDLMACDSYKSQSNDYAIAATIAGEVDTMRGYGKPCFHSEFGGDIGGASPASQPTHLHNGIWAGLCSGDAVSPLLWTDGGSFPMVDPATTTGAAMLAHYRSLSVFAASLTYLGRPELVKALPSFSSTAVRGWGMRLGTSNDRGFVWCQSTQALNRFSTRPTITIGSLVNTTYRATWYDAWTGATVETITVRATKSGNTYSLRASIPNSLAAADIAMSFQPASEAVVPFGRTLSTMTVAGSSAGAGTSSGDDAGRGCGLGAGISIVLLGLSLAIRRRSPRA
ncbi:MAG: DUF5060 domain-containing protein [Planctomycetes bacterium]|nr:DUF5060 domain-containing protein [Planctomycetota bacterium]